jgi:hypothetical protein
MTTAYSKHGLLMRLFRRGNDEDDGPAADGPVGGFLVSFFLPEIRAWRGEQPLWKVFWLYGVATSLALITVYVVAFFIDRVTLRQVLLVLFAPYTAWILVSVWRCANNTREYIWTLLARLLTVAWACNTILVLVFLEMNLIARYYLR